MYHCNTWDGIEVPFLQSLGRSSLFLCWLHFSEFLIEFYQCSQQHWWFSSNIKCLSDISLQAALLKIQICGILYYCIHYSMCVAFHIYNYKVFRSHSHWWGWMCYLTKDNYIFFLSIYRANGPAYGIFFFVVVQKNQVA